jgi:hypothetical protein
MGSAARFHRYHRARGKRRQPFQKLDAFHGRQLTTMPTIVAHACVENLLCQIHTNCRSIHLNFPFLH